MFYFEMNWIYVVRNKGKMINLNLKAGKWMGKELKQRKE